MKRETVITLLGAILAIAVFAFIAYENFKLAESKSPKTTYKNPIAREMSRNRYERNLSRKAGRQLKQTYDYINR